MEKHEFALETFKNMQGLILFMDQKAGAVLLVSGLILTTFLEFSKELAFTLGHISVLGVATFILGITTLTSLVYVIYLSFFEILRPQLARHYESCSSLIYFEHLSRMDRELIFHQLKNSNEEILLKNITDQNHEISKILNSKTIQLYKAMNFLFFSIASLIAFILTSRLI